MNRFDAQFIVKDKGSQKLYPASLLIADRSYTLYLFLRHGNQVVWIQRDNIPSFQGVLNILKEHEKDENFLMASFERSE
jgi:hypothetical protein